MSVNEAPPPRYCPKSEAHLVAADKTYCPRGGMLLKYDGVAYNFTLHCWVDCYHCVGCKIQVAYHLDWDRPGPSERMMREGLGVARIPNEIGRG